MSAEPAAGTPDSGRKLFFGLFIFPLLIAVGMALLLCSVVFLTSEKETPDSLIASVKSGAKGKRWQKAFELSNELNRRPDAATPAVLNEILHVYDPASGYDSRTRSYMALALARFEDPSAAAALERELTGGDAEVRLYALWTLGQKKSAASLPKIMPLLRDEDPVVRQTAAYVLGAVGDGSAASALRPMLSDGTPDVRWNAALALARLGDASGRDVLRAMLDRKALETELKMGEEQVEAAIVNACKGLVLIRDAGSITILESIAKNDRNLKVRQAAIDALNALKKK